MDQNIKDLVAFLKSVDSNLVNGNVYIFIIYKKIIIKFIIIYYKKSIIFIYKKSQNKIL